MPNRLSSQAAVEPSGLHRARLRRPAAKTLDAEPREVGETITRYDNMLRSSCIAPIYDERRTLVQSSPSHYDRLSQVAWHRTSAIVSSVDCSNRRAADEKKEGRQELVHAPSLGILKSS